MSIIGQSEPKDVFSNSGKVGEWKTRKINLWSVLRSFVSQLKLGQDMTKISLPAELCHPYSMLEVMAQRELALYKVLFGINEVDDALERFLYGVRFFVALLRSESYEKKPYNPVLGETHMSWTDEGSEHGRVEFMSEQISHHPPVSAFNVKNQKHNLEIDANISFGVKFGGNSVTVATTGGCVIHVHNRKEKFIFTKCIPDMTVKNVVWGTKYIIWNGEVNIECPETGYHAKIVTDEGSRKSNILTGSIFHKDKPTETIYTIEGVCGNEIWLVDTKTKAKKLLVDVNTLTMSDPKFLPFDKLDASSSVIMWGKVNQHIIENNYHMADEEKQRVEVAQRQLRAQRAEANVEFKGTFFHKDEDGLWRLDKDTNIDKILNPPVAVPETAPAPETAAPVPEAAPASAEAGSATAQPTN